MKVLFTSAEVAPFAKIGGMADVVGSLPAALRKLGVDARVILPGYGFIRHFKYNIEHIFTFEFTHRQGVSTVNVYSTVYNSVPHYFIQVWPFFGQDGSVYADWSWDVPRFIHFNQTIMATIWELGQRLDWFPDVVHVHDWHTSLIPFLIHESRGQQAWSNLASVLTIHNIAYQGSGVGGWLWSAGIPGRHQPDLVYQGLTDNLLGIGIAYADVVNTVSPRYASEIQYPYAGFELAGLIRTRNSDVEGILNGLDTEYWNPATDPLLVSNFDTKTLEENRIANKRHLQSRAMLPVRDDVPLIGVVSRLAAQKGFDFAFPALRQLMIDTDVQFIALGTGDEDLEYQLWQMGRDFRWKTTAFVQHDPALAQQIYAGSDIFLMPSHFEPCGIGQLIAMRYGSLPLVRETGGLADTVSNYDNDQANSGTGFVFSWETSDAVLGTLRWAINTFYNRRDAWRNMQKRGMLTDFSWTKSANQYRDIYRKAINKHQ